MEKKNAVYLKRIYVCMFVACLCYWVPNFIQIDYTCLFLLGFLQGVYFTLFSGLSEKEHAHCAGSWLKQQISNLTVMDQLICLSSYFKICLLKKTKEVKNCLGNERSLPYIIFLMRCSNL